LKIQKEKFLKVLFKLSGQIPFARLFTALHCTFEKFTLFDINGLFKTVLQWGTFYLFIADFITTEIKGGAKELVVMN
jgi:hypothetical protein